MIDRTSAIALWANHKSAAKQLKSFGQSCASHERRDDILYIVKIHENGLSNNDRAEVFMTLRSNNISSPSMHWPYLSIASEGSLAVCRLVVPKLLIWDFRTGRRIN